MVELDWYNMLSQLKSIQKSIDALQFMLSNLKKHNTTIFLSAGLTAL